MSLTWLRFHNGFFMREHVVHDPRRPYWKVRGAGMFDGRYLDYGDAREAKAEGGTGAKITRVNLTPEAHAWPTMEDLRKAVEDYERSGAPERVEGRLKAIKAKEPTQ